MKKASALLAVLMSMTLSSTALAHRNHDDPPAQVIKLELASKANRALVYVTESGAKVSTIGATGTLTFASGKSTKEVALQPGGENTMKATARTKLTPGTKAQATVIFADKSTASADFVVK